MSEKRKSPSCPKTKVRLVLMSETGKKSVFESDSNVLLVGRRLPPGPAQIGLDDDLVSGHHARISLEAGGVWIEDLNSSNGTWVDGRKIGARTRLEPGSIVHLGRTALFLESGSTVPAARIRQLADDARTPVETLPGGESLAKLAAAEATADSARERLVAVCELTEAMNEIESVDALGPILLTHLHRAFVRFGSAVHSGLLWGPELILKIYRPEAEAPSCSLTLARHVSSLKSACLWRLGEAGAVDPSMSLVSAGTTSAVYAPLCWGGEVFGVVYFDATSATASFDKDDLRLLQLMATQTANYIKNLQLRQTLQREAAIRARLLAQFPPSIAERLSKLPDHTAIPSQRLDRVTILISDVRGFTKLAAEMEPEDVFRMLNDMFHELTPLVLKHNGTVDKYVGDAILSVFGSPEADDKQDEHAIQAALEMQAAILALENGRWKGRPPFRVGIALHAGPAIHGFIGAPERMEYTVIGNTINVASRYCDATPPGKILVSPAIYSRLHYCLEVEHPPLQVETKHEGALKAYVLKGWKGSRTPCPDDGPGASAKKPKKKDKQP